MKRKNQFDYEKAFSRNIGWVTPDEQQILRTKRIAVAGLGGVGGNHLVTLTRMGVGKFNVSDFDTYDVANFNRQIGASMSTIGQAKSEVLLKHVKDINPELEINHFDEGVNKENVDNFLFDVDLYVDSLDFFSVDIRRLLFNKCAEKNIPAITAAPLGMGCAFLAFLPGKMSFEQYFRLDGESEKEQLIRFLVGLSPTALQNEYLIYPQAVDIPNHKGPSTPMAVELCAGFAGSEALKILLFRGNTIAAPWGIHFDAYRNKLTRTWRPFGNNNPIQRLSMHIARKKFGQATKKATSSCFLPQNVVEKILDLARWAPSGDNAQPWRFSILSESEFVIYASDTRNEIVYDLEGHASQIALGALQETISIAASAEGLTATFSSIKSPEEGKYNIQANLAPMEDINPDILAPYITTRSVQRRSMNPKPLTDKEKSILESTLPKGFEIVWFESLSERWKITRLLWKNAKLRLTLPEAYYAHKHGIEWNCQFSEQHMPDKSLGVDFITRKIMKWAMASWERVSFMNKYFAGTVLPRLQMDLIPNVMCSAQFVLVSHPPPSAPDNYISAGRAIQRFWLTATKLGLQLQPAYTPIVFSEYDQNKVKFTKSQTHLDMARNINETLHSLLGDKNTSKSIFMGRIGHKTKLNSRSVRLQLKDLIIED